MTRFLSGSEAASVKYLKHVLHNGSFYPITTFFLVTCAVVIATWMGGLNHLHALVVLGFVALILLLIADRRDMKIANASFEVQLEAVRDLVANSAAMSAAVATMRSDHQEMSMHAQDVSIAHLTDHTTKDT